MKSFFLLAVGVFYLVTTSSVLAGSQNNYDGRQPLECNVNVNCSNKSEVVAKMTRRWAAFSKQTVYGRICLEAISRVEKIHDQVWSAGIAYNQIGVCNMQ